MTDLERIAAILLANFVTVRVARCERLWRWQEADPSPRLRARLLVNALAGENLIASCHRQCVLGHLLEHGHRAFFDRIAGGVPDGWRLHFFCYDPATILLLYDTPVGKCGPGDPVSFDAERFVVHHLHRLERQGKLGTPDKWWDSDNK